MIEDFKNKKVVVTGGAGFIGSNLVGHLLSIGANVIVLDNFSTGKRSNIETFTSHPNFKLIEGDIRNIKDCEKAVSGVEYVLHEAALGSVPRSINDPKTTNDVNIGGFVNMLWASVNAKVKRFVYAASSSTYGDHPGLPKVEENIGNPLSPYAVTKYVNELYAENFSKIYGIETIGLRYFNVFGPKQDPDGAYAAVIPLFIKQLINHQSPLINGDGLTSRDFTYIDNVIQANLRALTVSTPEALNTVYNVAVGDRTTLIELVDLLRKFLSIYDPEISAIETKFGPERAGDVKHSLASIDKISRLLGYNPQYNLAKGIEEAIGWYWGSLK